MATTINLSVMGGACTAGLLGVDVWLLGVEGELAAEGGLAGAEPRF